MMMKMIRNKVNITTNRSKVVNIRRLICSMWLSHSHIMKIQAKGEERNNTILLWKKDQEKYNTRRSSHHTRMMM